MPHPHLSLKLASSAFSFPLNHNYSSNGLYGLSGLKNNPVFQEGSAGASQETDRGEKGGAEHAAGQ